MCVALRGGAQGRSEREGDRGIPACRSTGVNSLMRGSTSTSTMPHVTQNPWWKCTAPLQVFWQVYILLFPLRPWIFPYITSQRNGITGLGIWGRFREANIPVQRHSLGSLKVFKPSSLQVPDFSQVPITSSKSRNWKGCFVKTVLFLIHACQGCWVTQGPPWRKPKID